MANSGKWYLIQSKHSANMVKDIVREGVGDSDIQMDDQSVIPVATVEGWRYYVTPCTLAPVPANQDDLLWSDSRIMDMVNNYPHTWNKTDIFGMFQTLRNEYEAERKNKIFIPVELRGCLLLTVQKSRSFLAGILESVVLQFKDSFDPKVQEELDGWVAEIDEYDQILEAIVGKKTSSEVQ